MDEAQLNAYISNGVEESLTLDYKASAALDRSDSRKREITKDISAMANSAGGTIVYGIQEYPPPKNHLPEKIDPIDRTQFSREWLEHIINNIRPRISGVAVHPVSLSTGPHDVAYVVEIPQAETAHQALDFRYYKRFNFESVPMADHEIRDVMHRDVTTPALEGLKSELEFNLEIATNSAGEQVGCHFLDEQFRRSIQLGAFSRLPPDAKPVIQKAYVAIGKANHVLETWASTSAGTRMNMQQEVMSTVRDSAKPINLARAKLSELLTNR